MSVFRFLLSILANLAMTVIGGFLAYSGGVGLFLTLQIYLFLETDLTGSGTTINDTLGAMNGGRMDMFGDATPWLIMFGQLIVGLPLLFFGITGLLRRLKTGLPDEDEDAAETPIGQIAQATVYFAGGTVGLVLLTLTLLDVFDYVSHVSGSQRAEAVIQRNWKSGGGADEIRGARYATYRFHTHAGEAVIAKTKVPNLAGKQFVEGNRIIVTYLADDPDVNEWEELRSLSDFLLPAVLYSVLLIGGFWGVKRNLFVDEEYA